MKSTFTCLHCGCTFPCNPRVKDQKYCNTKECRESHHDYERRNRELQFDRDKKHIKEQDPMIVKRNTTKTTFNILKAPDKYNNWIFYIPVPKISLVFPNHKSDIMVIRK